MAAEEALATSDHLLNEGKGRQALSGLLWLLETISTAFRGTGAADDSYRAAAYLGN